jgi:hypothetical protein
MLQLTKPSLPLLCCVMLERQQLLERWRVPGDAHALHVWSRALHQAPDQTVSAEPPQTGAAQEACAGPHSRAGPAAAYGLLWWVPYWCLLWCLAFFVCRENVCWHALPASVDFSCAPHKCWVWIGSVGFLLTQRAVPCCASAAGPLLTYGLLVRKMVRELDDA